MKVKVCGLTDIENVRAIILTGIDYAGFIFYKDSPRYVGKDPDKLLFGIIPPGIRKTGVFVNEPTDRLKLLSEKYSLDIVQLHGDEDEDYCMDLRSEGLQVIKVFRLNAAINPDKINAFTDCCDFFLFDTDSGGYGGSGKKFDWDLIAGIQPGKPFFISGGISPDDASQIRKINNNMLYGVDINSRFEYVPGKKDTAKVRQFISDIKNITK